MEVGYQVVYERREGTATCTQIGLYGLRIKASEPLEIGAVLALELALDGRERNPVQTIARVTRTMQSGQASQWFVNLRFQQIDHGARQRLYDAIIAMLIATGEAVPAAASEPASADASLQASPDGPTRVLVVDDDAITLRLVCVKLREIKGLDVVSAGSGAEALRQAAEGPISLAFLDIRLPDTDGITLLSDLRATSPRMAAIVMTNYPSADVTIDALRNQVADFIKKPFSNLDIIRSVAVRTLDDLRVRRDRELLLEKLVQSNGELKATNRNLRIAQEELVQQQKLVSLGHISAGLAHQINNPAAFVLGNLSVINDLVMPQIAELPDSEAVCTEMKELLSDALAGIRRVAAIARDLRVFSIDTYSSGRQGVDVSDIVRTCVSLIRGRAAGRCAIETDLGSLQMVHANSAKLSDTVVHILTNALEAFTDDDEEKNRVDVRISATDADVTLTVTDNGAGIPEDVLPEVFTPFFTTKAPNSARGLGLSFAHGVMTELGGSIRATSQPGQGTTITMRFPSALASVNSVIAGTATPPIVPELERPRILVVDDEDLMLRLYKQLFRDDFIIDTAPNGREALALVEEREGDYQAIICDLLMPVMGGIELYERLQQSNPELISRLIFCSGGATSEADLAFCRMVSNPVLEKPVAPEQLRAAVATLLAPALIS